MKYALYPGCTVLGRGRNYEMAARAVAKETGIEFQDIADFECCGFPIKSVHQESAYYLAARNLLAAENEDLDVCTLCSACTSSLTEVNKHLSDNFMEKTRILALLKKAGFDYRLSRNIIVKHFVKILYEEIGIPEISRLIKKKLSSLKVAAHYGCHYLKPTDIYQPSEDPENPRSLDDLISVTGAVPLDYNEKTRCCGASLLAISEDLAFSIARPKMTALKRSSVDAIILMCPFCSVMFDDNQRKMEQKFNEVYAIPVLYYPQLLGLAMGLDDKALGLRMNRVSTKALMEKIK
jgi:heterodisulfide reductase subunit B